jgi:cardiolipin synthase
MYETNLTPAGLSAVGSPEERVQRVFERVSDAPLREGNRLSLLKNGPQTYDEWLEEIGRAKKWIHLENYIFKADGVGYRFAEALKDKVAEGVAVRVLYDWYGSMDTAESLWRNLRGAGVDVRMFNPFSLGAPLEAFLRDHRKSLAIDGEYGSVGGVCIADQWVECSPETGLPYRDTAVGFRGPAVADLEVAFARVWDRSGTSLPAEERPGVEGIAPVGEEAARLVIQEPGKLRIARMLQIIAAAAKERLWIADAYFMAGPHLNQALMSAARDGVDVRLLLPATNDLPLVGTISRAGYRQLLESGVKIFEYGGPMMHAKTTVADGWSSRIGSTNLNVTGLLTDWEIDLVVEDRRFGARMEEMFEEDLADSREIRLGGTTRRPRAEPERRIAPARRRSLRGLRERGTSGSGSRAVATAARAGATAFREGGEDLQRYERTVAIAASAGLLGTALLGARFPRLLAWPLAAAAGLVGASGLLRTLRHPTLLRERRDAGDSSHRR